MSSRSMDIQAVVGEFHLLHQNRTERAFTRKWASAPLTKVGFSLRWHIKGVP